MPIILKKIILIGMLDRIFSHIIQHNRKGFIYGIVLGLISGLCLWYMVLMGQYKEEISGHLFLNTLRKETTVLTKCKYNKNGPRILCAVFTHKKVHSKVHYVHNTWGNR